MSLLYTNKEAFERVKKYLEDNQYSFEFYISEGQFLIKIIEQRLTNSKERVILNVSNKREVKTMTENRERMLSEMIRIYGFEHEVTIEFARLLESDIMTDKDLETILKAHKENPVMLDE